MHNEPCHQCGDTTVLLGASRAFLAPTTYHQSSAVSSGEPFSTHCTLNILRKHYIGTSADHSEWPALDSPDFGHFTNPLNLGESLFAYSITKHIYGLYSVVRVAARCGCTGFPGISNRLTPGGSQGSFYFLQIPHLIPIMLLIRLCIADDPILPVKVVPIFGF